MKGKKPTYNQKKFLRSKGLDPYNWLVQKNTLEYMQVVNRYSGKERVIKKVSAHGSI